MSFLLPHVKEDWDLKPVEEANIMTFTFLGMLLGAYIWGFLSDRYGRRFGYLGTTLFTAIFGLASAACPNVYTLTACRFFVGLGLGGAPVAFSLFCEFVPTAARGQTLILLEGLFWSGGAVLEALLAWCVLGSGLSWRWLLVFSALPLFIVCAFYCQLPESPRWLTLQNRESDAVVILKSVMATNAKPGTAAAEKIADMPDSFELAMPSDTEPATVCDLFTPPLMMTTTLLWIIWTANVLTYYGIVLVIPMYFKDE